MPFLWKKAVFFVYVGNFIYLCANKQNAYEIPLHCISVSDSLTPIDSAHYLHRTIYHHLLSVEKCALCASRADVLVALLLLVALPAGEGYRIRAYPKRTVLCLCQQPPVDVRRVGDIRLLARSL